MKKLALTCSALTLALLMGVSAATAETVKTETVVRTQHVAGVGTVDFTVFDLNKDGIYSMNEVGEHLFRIFDTDGNELIDNIEWDKKIILTVMPMEKQTFKSVDYDNDGIADKTEYTRETFFDATGLNRFDAHNDGLSAKEFIGESFYKLDEDNNLMVDIHEWKRGYLKSLPEVPQHNKRINYNE